MQYTITKISSEQPREWGEGANKTYYIKVMLSGHNKAVSVGKKSPDALKVGDTVDGTITETQYDTDRFTQEKKQYTPSSAKSLQDSTTMYVSYAKDILLKLIETQEKDIPKKLEEYVKFVAQHGRQLKNESEAQPTLKEQWNQTLAAKLDRKEPESIPNDEVPVEAYDDIDQDTEIDLDEIPF